MSRGDTLAGKVALITGGARGQGEAEGRLFTDEGATVVLADVIDDDGQRVAKEIGAQYFHLDVASEEEWDTVVADVMATHGHLDVVVNNAGIFRSARLVQETVEQWDTVIAVNQTGSIGDGKIFVCPAEDAVRLRTGDRGELAVF